MCAFRFPDCRSVNPSPSEEGRSSAACLATTTFCRHCMLPVASPGKPAGRASGNRTQTRATFCLRPKKRVRTGWIREPRGPAPPLVSNAVSGSGDSGCSQATSPRILSGDSSQSCRNVGIGWRTYAWSMTARFRSCGHSGPDRLRCPYWSCGAMPIPRCRFSVSVSSDPVYRRLQIVNRPPAYE